MPFSNDEPIDFERVVIDPEYRRRVIVLLNAEARHGEQGPVRGLGSRRAGYRSAAASY